MSVYQKTWFKAFSWAVVLTYMGGIFYVSGLQMPHREPPFPHLDKILHFCAYFGLAFLTAHAYAMGTSRKRFWIAFCVASLYGLSDEFHQSFVPGRDVSFWDWVADTTGAWFGAYLFLKSEPVWRKSVRLLK